MGKVIMPLIDDIIHKKFTPTTKRFVGVWWTFCDWCGLFVDDVDVLWISGVRFVDDMGVLWMCDECFVDVLWIMLHFVGVWWTFCGWFGLFVDDVDVLWMCGGLFFVDDVDFLWICSVRFADDVDVLWMNGKSYIWMMWTFCECMVDVLWMDLLQMCGERFVDDMESLLMCGAVLWMMWVFLYMWWVSFFYIKRSHHTPISRYMGLQRPTVSPMTTVSPMSKKCHNHTPQR